MPLSVRVIAFVKTQKGSGANILPYCCCRAWTPRSINKRTKKPHLDVFRAFTNTSQRSIISHYSDTSSVKCPSSQHQNKAKMRFLNMSSTNHFRSPCIAKVRILSERTKGSVRKCGYMALNWSIGSMAF